MTFERANTREVTGGVIVEIDLRFIDVDFSDCSGRLVIEHGHELHWRKRCIGVQHDFLLPNAELRLLYHLTIDRDPAALHVQLRLTAGAGEHFGKAFCEANGFRH